MYAPAKFPTARAGLAEPPAAVCAGAGGDGYSCVAWAWRELRGHRRAVLCSAPERTAPREQDRGEQGRAALARSQPRRMPRHEPDGAAHQRMPADARAAVPRSGRVVGVPAKPGHVHEHVACVGIERHPPARARLAEALELAGGRAVADRQQPRAVQQMLDAAGAVIGRRDRSTAAARGRRRRRTACPRSGCRPRSSP